MICTTISSNSNHPLQAQFHLENVQGSLCLELYDEGDKACVCGFTQHIKETFFSHTPCFSILSPFTSRNSINTISQKSIGNHDTSCRNKIKYLTNCQEDRGVNPMIISERKRKKEDEIFDKLFKV